MLTATTSSMLRSSVRCMTRRTTLNYKPSRGIVTVKEVKYTATATAKGAGRDGHVECNGLKFDLAMPKEMGGNGKGENPEQLFAMGYSGCLLGAIQAVAKGLGKADMAKNAVVRASVHIGPATELKGFGLAVDIKVEGVDEEVLKAGHELCPYSRALTKGIVVNVSTA